MSVWAVLVAAGRGERLASDRPKAFANLRGRPLLAESLGRLDDSSWIEAIVVVAPPGWEEPAILLTEELGCSKVRACVTGGSTRAESVRSGIAEVAEDATAVVVHDSARPLLPEEVLERVLTALTEGYEAAVPGLALADTIKRVRSGEVVETLPRAELIAAQTPQAFVPAPLREALAGALPGATDCASLLEARGGRIKVVPGDRRLVKVTDAQDLELVAILLDAE